MSCLFCERHFSQDLLEPHKQPTVLMERTCIFGTQNEAIDLIIGFPSINSQHNLIEVRQTDTSLPEVFFFFWFLMICHESHIINERRNFQYLILNFEACGCLWAESFSVSKAYWHICNTITFTRHSSLQLFLQGYTKACGSVKKPLISVMWVESVVGRCLTEARGGKIWTLNSNSVNKSSAAFCFTTFLL